MVTGTVALAVALADSVAVVVLLTAAMVLLAGMPGPVMPRSMSVRSRGLAAPVMVTLPLVVVMVSVRCSVVRPFVMSWSLRWVVDEDGGRRPSQAACPRLVPAW
jgi:hypothetical protein